MASQPPAAMLGSTATDDSIPSTNVENDDDDKSHSKMSKRALKRLKNREKRLKDQKDQNNEIQTKTALKLELKNAKKNLIDLIGDEIINETEYYFENGLRKVRPYYYNFIANAKGRWFGRKLVDVFTEEFQNYSYDKCKDFIEKKSLSIENKEIDINYIIKNGDVIVNRVHRHELPITDQQIDIILNTDQLLVVNKPASIPMHPCGRYRHNSLQYILAKDHGLKNLRVLYRIDRLTSGLVILAKTEEKTREIMEQIKSRQMKKIYLCKVEGEFPKETIDCNMPIDVLSHKLGVYYVSDSGKESMTTFKRLFTDGKTSILRCEPKTGRTHQIRIHLQYLGHPIINDPIYNGFVWGNEKGKHGNFGKTREQLISDLTSLHQSTLYYADAGDGAANQTNGDDNNVETITGIKDSRIKNNSNNNSSSYSAVIGSNSTVIDSNSTVIDSNSTVIDSNSTNDENHSEEPLKKKQKTENYKTCKLQIPKTEALNVPLSNNGNDDNNNATICDINTNNNNSNHNYNTTISNTNTDNSNDNNLKISKTDVIVDNNLLEKNERPYFDALCPDCNNPCVDPTPESMYIYLHALSYEGPGWKYSTPLPAWASGVDINSCK